MKKLIIALVALCFGSSLTAQTFKPRDKSVRFIYLVSKDRKVNKEYQQAIRMAALDLQVWYGEQMGGYTFKINNPVVEVVQSDKEASYFYAHPNGDNKDSWGFYNTLDECNRLIGAKQNDPNYIWVLYSDGPGNSGRGGGGVCVLPEDDLLGLIGKHPTQPDINRWIAGLGHELGHAFGLSHPDDTKKDADAIMWTGIYGKYPSETYLTPEDKERLSQSYFFFDGRGNPIRGVEKEIARFDYNSGYFSRHENQKTGIISWAEGKTDGSESYSFDEEREDDNFYYLDSDNRTLDIAIPKNGGQSLISSDEGTTWRNFQVVTLK